MKSKKVEVEVVKSYRLPMYEHAIENILNMFMPDEKKSFEECEDEGARENHIYLSLLKLENLRRQKYMFKATAYVQKLFDEKVEQDPKVKELAIAYKKAKKKSEALKALTTDQWIKKRNGRRGLLLLKCVDCEALSELQTQDKSDYVFWMKTSTHPAGECVLCQGKETAIAAIP